MTSPQPIPSKPRPAEARGWRRAPAFGKWRPAFLEARLQLGLSGWPLPCQCRQTDVGGPAQAGPPDALCPAALGFPGATQRCPPACLVRIQGWPWSQYLLTVVGRPGQAPHLPGPLSPFVKRRVDEKVTPWLQSLCVKHKINYNDSAHLSHRQKPKSAQRSDGPAEGANRGSANGKLAPPSGR